MSDKQATVLRRILQRKREELRARRAERPLSAIESELRALPPCRGFAAALQARVAAGHNGIIAESKKASPSKGIIREAYDPAAIARSYERGGATCISVLTDADFHGSGACLQAARAACDLPILRKDFIIDAYQVAESRAMQADCILLIAAALSDSQMAELYGAAQEHGMDALIEVHNRAELDRALPLEAPLLGINNRDLHTFKTDLNTTWNLLPHIPKGRLPITESGILKPAHIDAMHERGVCAFLVGEAFMRAADPGAKLKEWFGTD